MGSLYLWQDHTAEKKKMNKKKKQILFFLLRVLIAVSAVGIILGFVVTPRIVRGNAMYPALRDGQLVLVSRISRVLPNRLVLYRSERGEEKIGRVIGEEEDVIRIEGSEILVNNNLLAREIPFPVPEGAIAYPYTVGRNSFFLVNDYREDITDSRTFGEIEREKIIGTIIFALQYRDF